MKKPKKVAYGFGNLKVLSTVLALWSVVSCAAFGQAKPVYVKPEEAMKLLSVYTPLVGDPPNGGVVRAAHMSGIVRAEFTVMPDGHVTDITNTSPAGGNSEFLFNYLRAQVISHLLFHPYTQDGLPVAMRTSLQAVYTNGWGKWVSSDIPAAADAPSSTATVTPPKAVSTPTSPQETGTSPNPAPKGSNAEWLQVVLATVGPHKCDGSYQPPAPKLGCQRDARIREAQMIAVTTDCMAASGDEHRVSALASVLVLDLKAAGALCTKPDQPSACDTDAILSCNKLPK